MTTSQQTISDFLAQRTLALVGLSRSGRKFGNAALRELRAKGYTVHPVHPSAETIGGVRCWPSLASLACLPEPVGGVLTVVPPAETEKVVAEAHAAGIPRVWMQQGSESTAAIRFCEAHGIAVVHHECVLMFAEPLGWFHRAHRWLWGRLGKLQQ
jgi:predicted CoA-binding protein